MSLDAEKRKKYGNSRRKIPQESLELMEKVIIGNPNIGISKKTLYMKYNILCLEKMIPTASYQTFCREIRMREIKKVQKFKSADKYEECESMLELTTQNQVGSSFELAHTYHTKLDFAVDIGNGKTDRPWCTILIDVYSRRILSFHLSFDPPSMVSNVLVIIECVRKYNKLPQTIVIDGGKEFRSENFDSLLSMYGVRIKVRPFDKVRYGNVVEQLFGFTNRSFINMLQESTQIMKNKHEVVATINLKNHANWNLDKLHEMLGKWIDNYYDVQIHPAHLNTPEEVFNNSIAATGKMLFISYHQFAFLTLRTLTKL
jgi:putative transposase